LTSRNSGLCVLGSRGIKVGEDRFKSI